MPLKAVGQYVHRRRRIHDAAGFPRDCTVFVSVSHSVAPVLAQFLAFTVGRGALQNQCLQSAALEAAVFEVQAVVLECGFLEPMTHGTIEAQHFFGLIVSD